MASVKIVELTVKDLADRLSACTGETPQFHARQVRHWAGSGVLDLIAHVPFRGEGATAARVFTFRHLAACVILNFYANQRADIEFLQKIARLLRNIAVRSDDEEFWQQGDGLRQSKFFDGLASAIDYARQIANGANAKEKTLYFQLYLTKNGSPEGGAFVKDIKPAALNLYWVEQRSLNVSALIPCIFFDDNGSLNEFASLEYNHRGEALVTAQD